MGKFAGFQSVELRKAQRSMFDLSHQKRVSTRMGRLTPVMCLECVPGDSFDLSTEILVRVAPLLAPIYDQMNLFVHVYFVPNRLLWDDWEEFITGGGSYGTTADPGLAPVPPFFDLGTVIATDPTLVEESSLSDYLGVPILTDIDPVAANWDGLFIDALPFLAYQLVWQEYYRDRNYLTDSSTTGLVTTIPVSSGELTDYVNMFLHDRAYMHDYFTSSLPFTQRGEEVLMPLAGSGTVTYLSQSEVRTTTGGVPAVSGTLENFGTQFRTSDNVAARLENIDDVIMDSSSVSINDFRSAYALQVWLERNAIGGSRYTESTQAHFGVKPQDSRLQRPEYVTGMRVPIKISEIVSTAYSNDGAATVPLANLAGHGIAYANQGRGRYFCAEHGFLMAICSIMNPPSYHQGLPRMFWARRSFLGYVWPTFSKLGEQEVAKAELYASPANLTEDVDGNLPLFGYQSRYADWKYVCNSSHGQFHSTLLFWTLTRHFSSSPELGNDFVEFDSATQDRVFAVGGDEDNFWLYVHNRVNVRRVLPYFGTPNTLGFG